MTTVILSSLNSTRISVIVRACVLGDGSAACEAASSTTDCENGALVGGTQPDASTNICREAGAADTRRYRMGSRWKLCDAAPGASR